MMKVLASRVRDAKLGVKQKKVDAMKPLINTDPNDELDTSLEDYSSNDEVNVSKIRLDEASVWLNRKHDIRKVILAKQKEEDEETFGSTPYEK